MRKRLLSALFALLITLTVGITASGTRNEEAKPSPETLSTVSSADAQNEKIYLGIYEGKLALFSGDGSLPTEIYGIYVRSLPKADRELLQNRMEISDEASLLRILEDYSS